MRTGQVGATWTRHPATAWARMYLFNHAAGVCRVHSSAEVGVLYASGVPSSADYDVECDYTIFSGNVGTMGLAGRINTSGALSCYHTFYSNNQVLLWKVVSGVPDTVGWWDGTLSGGGATYKLRLSMHGTTIKVFVNDVERISVTDSSVTAAGRAGLRATSPNDAWTGKHVDNFRAYDGSTAAAGRSFVAGPLGL